jgi:mono/diheme cytochrome c family protein
VTSAPDSRHGKELAARLCSNCHLVGNPEQQQANADVPSFPEIAKKEGQNAGTIMAHIVLPKHPMPTIPVTKSELADLAAYILSLRGEVGNERLVTRARFRVLGRAEFEGAGATDW